jgi:anaerobic selenocysteine-containing dehydrogenase
MNDGRLQAVLLAGGADPVHGFPAALGFRDALMKVPLVASFGSFEDDSTTLADLVLPSSLPLEDWGDATSETGAAAGALSMQQPVVGALFDTRSVWDVLLTIADELGDPLRSTLPWATFKDLLRSELDQLRPADTAQPVWWTSLLQHGVYPAGAKPAGGGATQGGLSVTSAGDAALAGEAQHYPFNLVVFPHNTLGAGEASHLPWLQSAPDPITSMTWQTWVELNPNVASSMNLNEGDIVVVESPNGRIQAPVYVSPAAPPEVVAIPLGQGHTDFGRWANGRGANPLALLAPLADEATGALAYGATRVSVSKTGKSVAMPKLEGAAPARQLPGQEVLKVLKL